ncbi:phospholipid phosphatase 1-like [Ptychodera flava]|uniref:phospholipid phosphatase 1-like n=1 Tax=Ptychodera flava TaxID=63121 RepID=UPI00396A6314
MASGAGKCCYILLDLLLLCIVAAPIAVVRLLSVPIYERGFFCSDESLKYPYKDSTVTSLMLYSFSLGLPVLFMIVVEATICVHRKTRQLEYLAQKSFNRCCCDVPINPYLFRTYKIIGMFLFGAAVTLDITDMTKNVIGRLRPHFFDVCQPDFSKINCSVGYITDFTCLGSDVDSINEARRSFVSGHSSFSAYCMIYLVLYLQGRMQWKGIRLLKPFLQFIALLLTIFCCLTRISDHKHHWSDVLAGFILGAAVALVMAYGVSDLFKKEDVHEKIEHINSEIVFMEMNPRSRGKHKPTTINSSFI